MLFDYHTTHPNSVDVLCGNVCTSPSALNIDYENEIAFSPVCPTFALRFVYPSQKLLKWPHVTGQIWMLPNQGPTV